MKLKLNKKALKNLSRDAEILPDNMTPQVGGGTGGCLTQWAGCENPTTRFTEETDCDCTSDNTLAGCENYTYGCGGGTGGGGGTPN